MNLKRVPPPKHASATWPLLGAFLIPPALPVVADFEVWNLHFTGAFTGDATVVLHFDPALLNGPLSDLVVQHYVNGTWVIPPNQVIDPVADTITFSTDSFSPFIVAQVPEPSSLVLFGLSFIGLLASIRRRRS